MRGQHPCVLFFLSGSLNQPGTLSPLVAFSGVARDFHLPGLLRPLASTATGWEKYRQPGNGNIQLLMGHVTPIPVFGHRQHGRIHTFRDSTNTLLPVVVTCFTFESRITMGAQPKQRPEG